MDETNILLPDGEYDIQISSSLQEKLSQVSKGQNSDINYASDTDDDQGLFQLKFSQYPTTLLPDPVFQLYPRKSSNSHYLISTDSTSNNKELILEGSALKTKDSEYVLVFDKELQKFKLCGLNSIIRMNKPRNTKKNNSELSELRELYRNSDSVPIPAEISKELSVPTTNTPKQQPRRAKKSLPKTESSSSAVSSLNKWENLQVSQSATEPQEKTSGGPTKSNNNEEDEFDFDNFDQFDDELSFQQTQDAKQDKNSPPPPPPAAAAADISTSKPTRPEFASKKLPQPSISPSAQNATAKHAITGTKSVPASPLVSTPGKPSNSGNKNPDDLDLDSLEDELEDELEEILGGEDKEDDDNEDYFSGFEIEEDPINNTKYNEKKQKHTDTDSNDNPFGKASTKPISLRGLVESQRDEADISSSEEE